MFRILVVIMIVVPAIEVFGLITVGNWIGGWQTFGLIILTGFVGALLAKKESQKVWNYARMEMSRGRVPGNSILDGICIFAGGLLLLTPGFFTDIIGFLLVLPASRVVFRLFILNLIRKGIQSGKIQYINRRF
ncbi:FxsA family protein [Longirhabdus pacifica]|uniref:FxsA family protein n=1 Tax=Longirhabdus pacifica TaxID=2305227 RepID=UPI001008F249|nr:FxsA family protein [Longirhabdus pacifica]